MSGPSKLLAVTAFLALNGSVKSDTSGDDESLQPNIVLVLTDDLGFGDVNWNNAGIDTTPFMEELAKSNQTAILHNRVRLSNF